MVVGVSCIPMKTYKTRCVYTDEGTWIKLIKKIKSNQFNIPLIPKDVFYKYVHFKIIGEKRVLAMKTEPIYSVCACQQNSTTRFVF